MKYTPGPWFTSDPIANPLDFPIRAFNEYGGVGDPICWFGANRTGEENLANTHLIKAAPKMLEALQRTARWLSESDESPQSIEWHLADLQEAIREATGEVR